MDLQAALEEAKATLRVRSPALADAIDGFAVTFDAPSTAMFGDGGIRFNRRFFEAMGAEERASALATVAFRLTSQLIRPCAGRDTMLWNLACSAVTNANLAALGFALPPGALIEPSCRDRTTDEVYESLRGLEGKVAPRRLDA